jgi:hypothetical protein
VAGDQGAGIVGREFRMTLERQGAPLGIGEDAVGVKALPASVRLAGGVATTWSWWMAGTDTCGGPSLQSAVSWMA